jgi:calcium/calmodulin-dependent protein kinase (CaM kinase) II
MSQEQTLLELSQRLLNAIVGGDWKTYTEICDEDLTCFEPEAGNNQVRGLPFHQFFFPEEKASNVTSRAHMIAPIVKFISTDKTAAIVSYTRLMQTNPENPVMVSFQETRVWQWKNGQWKHVHFHKSRL